MPECGSLLLSCAARRAALCAGASWQSDTVVDGVQAVKQLTEAVAAMPEGACPDLLILPLYAAMPLELQVCCHAWCPLVPGAWSFSIKQQTQE